MTCKEAERLVMPYIKDELTDEELGEFLTHMESCTECREELEIYFTVDVGIRQLDSETGNYNIKGTLEAAIEQSRQRLQLVRCIKIARYAVSTVSIMALVITILLQCRIWIQWGLL
ncbi:anti-sigma factor family protein [Lacrimispora saccharolytica]|uniref:Anti-sigma-W factor RsiW n=1 Tax=Lacrimispora saccharolytica (strain ATCC 35040 / DSM 2544 / NRCC 2533 / WM1) TaxID=610130 RepID=D9R011_LACSW|nr:zf-HC2 domain-containing protein [Lacrimispora saccharolytica]ADL04462.1 putative transmembrane anti-sigma factor [[Clostridium] saccharolyticum WM1]QRV21278.1 zf-HC2 domain-containing protein [Lacrimispora saccharolytica]